MSSKAPRLSTADKQTEDKSTMEGSKECIFTYGASISQLSWHKFMISTKGVAAETHWGGHLEMMGMGKVQYENLSAKGG